MKRLFTLLAVLAAFTVSYGQSECDGTRYYQEIFSDVTETSNINYGSNIDLFGGTTNLLMDVMEPVGDTQSLRPLIVMVHGGSFVFGNKDVADVTGPGEKFAKRGYVTAQINYRLGLPLVGLDSVAIIEAVLRGVHDTKAAVRWFYEDAQGSNTYGIDTTRIYVLGVSAGAIIALHYAYLDDLAELPADLDTTQAGLGGGMEGNSGNPGFSDNIQGVINISGALGDTAWMEPGDLPVVSLHAPDDDIVPYYTATASLFGVSLLVVDGSETVHIKADDLGLDNCLYTEIGGGHTPHVSSAAYLDTLMWFSGHFVAKLTCGETVSCYEFATGLEDQKEIVPMSVYPNPSYGSFKIAWEGLRTHSNTLSIYDIQGKVVHTEMLQPASEYEIRTNAIPPGLYYIKIQNEDQVGVERLMIR